MRTEAVETAYLALVGRRIRATRVLLGVVQDEVAQRAGMSRVTLSNIERGQHAGSLVTYLRISRALGVRMGALLDEETP